MGLRHWTVVLPTAEDVARRARAGRRRRRHRRRLPHARPVGHRRGVRARAQASAANVSQRRGSPRAVARVEPLLARGGRAVGPALRIDTARGALLDAVVADGGGRVQPVRDVLVGQVLDEAGLDRVRGPDAGVAVGLQLQPHRAGRLPLAVSAHLLIGAQQVLDVVPVLVGDHVRLGERAAARAEAGAQVVVERQVDVDLLVGRAVERADGGASRRRSRSAWTRVKKFVGASR